MSIPSQPSAAALRNIDRQLGPGEIYSSSRHALGLYKSVINACRYSISHTELRGQPASKILEEAIARVILNLPSLSVGIAGQDTSKPWFVTLPTVDLRCHFEYVDMPIAGGNDQNSALLGIITKQHDLLWPSIESRPPWKIIAVAHGTEGSVLRFDVIFAVHHSIGDGRSTSMLHTMLLDELSHPSGPPAQLSGHILHLPSDRKLKQPLEELINFSKSWTFLIGTLFKELGPAWLQRRAAVPWTGKNIAREPCQTGLRLVTIPAASSLRVLVACREHRVTLTPLIHALVLVSLARCVSGAQAFCSSTPIDLRPWIKWQSEEPKVPFGVFVTTQNHRFEHSTICALQEDGRDGAIWSIASGLRNEIKQHLKSVPQDDIMSMLSWVSDWREFWLQKIGTPRQNSWEVSNIGSIGGAPLKKIDRPTRGWQIDRSIFSQGATVTGAAISVNVSGVTGGSICISLSWQLGIVETEVVEALATGLQQWFDQL